MFDDLIFNPRQVDPALLTLQEYTKLVNEKDKWHPDHAYDYDVERMSEFKKVEDYPKLVKTMTINGIRLSFRLKEEKPLYVKTDENGNVVKINGEVQYFSDEEVARLGKRSKHWSVVVFDEDNKAVATVQDEWGTVLIAVAREYRGFGLGPILGRIARSIEPDKTSGGFTPAGYANFRKVHREFVRDALVSGRYRNMIRSGAITLDRVKEIVDSARLDIKQSPRPAINLSSNDPKDWVMYGEDGAFVIYDRKLKDIVEDGNISDYFIERMIKGYVLVRIPSDWVQRGEREWGLIVRFGGDSDNIKKFLVGVALSWCASENVDLAVDMVDLKYVDDRYGEKVGEPSKRTGMMRQMVRPKAPMAIEPMTRGERVFRRAFDPYDEFKSRILEIAEGKWPIGMSESLNEEILSDLPVPTDEWTDDFVWGFWMKPDGQFLDLDASTHTLGAIEKLGIPVPANYDPGVFENDDVIAAAIERGWVRGRYTHHDTLNLQGKRTDVEKVARRLAKSKGFYFSQFIADFAEGGHLVLQDSALEGWLNKGTIPSKLGALRQFSVSTSNGSFTIEADNSAEALRLARQKIANENVAPLPKVQLIEETNPEVSDEILQSFVQKLVSELGLEKLHASIRGDDLSLDMIVVPNDKRKMGLGTIAMQKFCAFADRYGLRILLTPALPGDTHGTTSRSRLVRFYKRFGFYENTGRKKDFSTRAGMIRDPRENVSESVIGYHGTTSVFNRFKMDRASDHPSKIGIWFASLGDAAEKIAKAVRRGEPPRVVKAKLNIEKSKAYPTYADFLDDWRKYGSTEKLRRSLIKLGFDSIEITHSDTDGAGDRTDWAVFNPSDIEIIETFLYEEIVLMEGSDLLPRKFWFHPNGEKVLDCEHTDHATFVLEHGSRMGLPKDRIQSMVDHVETFEDDHDRSRALDAVEGDALDLAFSHGWVRGGYEYDIYLHGDDRKSVRKAVDYFSSMYPDWSNRIVVDLNHGWQGWLQGSEIKRFVQSGRLPVGESMLKEGRGAYLYHGTPLENLLFILRDNVIKTGTNWRGEGDRIATSRDWRVARDFGIQGEWSGYPAMLVLDERKLSQRYKIKPHRDVDNEGVPWSDESEEMIMGNVEPFDQYLVSINIDPQILDHAATDQGFLRHLVERGFSKSMGKASDAIESLRRHPKLNVWQPRTGAVQFFQEEQSLDVPNEAI